MRFNFSYAQDVSQTQMAAFEMAGKIWASYLQQIPIKPTTKQPIEKAQSRCHNDETN